MKKISDFVDQLRIEYEEEEEIPRQPRSSVNTPGFEEAQKRLDNAVLQAEKFKASLEKPPGMSLHFDMGEHQQQDNIGQININGIAQGAAQAMTTSDLVLEGINFQCPQNRDSNSMNQAIGMDGRTDDDFFHLTCHIDSNLKSKIEKGEYVDLDKLLPGERSSMFDGRTGFSNETKLEWVQSEGSTYLVPAKKASKVNSFRKWEQAFRMYATIYCTVNPQRAREIWQYISVINTASMSYNWDSVYNYDIVFRQLMEFNPRRSWAVTYNQMWNLSMTNPIGQNQSQNRRATFSGYTNTQNLSGGGSLKKKLDYCWSFNKGMKCKFGKKCKFIERCSYCDSPAHRVVNCEKLDKKDREQQAVGVKKFKSTK